VLSMRGDHPCDLDIGVGIVELLAQRLLVPDLVLGGAGAEPDKDADLGGRGGSGGGSGCRGDLGLWLGRGRGCFGGAGGQPGGGCTYSG